MGVARTNIVVHALIAAYDNPKWVLEYLYSVILTTLKFGRYSGLQLLLYHKIRVNVGSTHLPKKKLYLVVSSRDNINCYSYCSLPIFKSRCYWSRYKQCHNRWIYFGWGTTPSGRPNVAPLNLFPQVRILQDI